MNLAAGGWGVLVKPVHEEKQLQRAQTHTHTHGQSEDSPAVGSRISAAPLRHTDRKLSEDMMVGRLDGWCLISWTVADRKTRGGRGRRRGGVCVLGGVVPSPEPSERERERVSL